MHLLIAYLLSNIFAENYRNRLICVKVVARENSDIFVTLRKLNWIILRKLFL